MCYDITFFFDGILHTKRDFKENIIWTQTTTPLAFVVVWTISNNCVVILSLISLYYYLNIIFFYKWCKVVADIIIIVINKWQ